jgi:hypothetical protein
MKVGRGLLGSVPKKSGKSKSYPLSFFLFAASLGVMSLSLMLSGCGDLSLNELLANQEPGDVGITPKSATVAEGSTIELAGKGGFKPYRYENKTTKETLNTVDGEYAEYTAPDSVSGTEEVQIEVTDSFGSKATALLTVYQTLSLGPASKNIEEGEAITFSAIGGVPDSGYDFFLNGEGPQHPPGNSWSHLFDIPGDFLVEVVDSLGNRDIAAVRVFADEQLAVELPEHDGQPQNWVLTGSSIILKAVHATPGFVFSIDSSTGAPGSLVDPPPPAPDEQIVYYAPSGESIVTIKLHDEVRGDLLFDIHVLDSEPPELTFPSTRTVEKDDSTVLTASGGVNGYDYRLEGPGSLNQYFLQDRKIRYKAPGWVPGGFPVTALVYVEDGLGRQKVAVITVVRDEDD